MSDFHNVKTYTAKKPHLCELCGQQINIGEKYINWVGKWCRDFYNDYFHLLCCDFVEEYVIEYNEEEWSTDQIHDWLYDECCRKCTEVDDCEQNLFRCKKAIDSIFHKNQI